MKGLFRWNKLSNYPDFTYYPINFSINYLLLFLYLFTLISFIFIIFNYDSFFSLLLFAPKKRKENHHLQKLSRS